MRVGKLLLRGVSCVVLLILTGVGIALSQSTVHPTLVHTGVGRQLREGQEIRMARPFRLASAADWALLGGLIHRSYQLVRLPYPY